MDKFRDLVEQNVGLAYMVAHNFEACGIEFDEIASICLMGLTIAANTYDPERSKFSTYCTTVMKNEVLKEIRKRKRYRMIDLNHISLNSELENGGLVAEIIPDPNDCFAEIITQDLAHSCFKRLSPTEKNVIDLLASGMTQNEVGKRLGVTQSQISRIRKKAVSKMKQALKD